MIWLTSIVGSKVARLVAAALAVVATILLVFQSGKKSEKTKQRLNDLKDYKKVKEALHEVDKHLNEPERIERLRDNGNIRKD